MQVAATFGATRARVQFAPLSNCVIGHTRTAARKRGAFRNVLPLIDGLFVLLGDSDEQILKRKCNDPVISCSCYKGRK
jgi:alkanesulfonate monooxygenase SsuD/methylene tetrahydromethanopterin reductase-like flavin-dependent oxidoreductase (luciferase family)